MKNNATILRPNGHRRGQTLRGQIRRLQGQIQSGIDRLRTLCLQYKQTQPEGSSPWADLLKPEDQDSEARTAGRLEARTAFGAKTKPPLAKPRN